MNKSTLLGLALLMLSACGGGGGGNSALPGGSQTKSQVKVPGSVMISIPVASTTTQSLARSVRYPQFVSPYASSVELSINGGTDTNFDVSSTSSLCVTIPTLGLRNCTLALGAPAGSDTFAFLVFSGPNGTGSQIASATTTQTIAAGAAFNFSIALNAAIGVVVGNVTSGSNGTCPDSNNSGVTLIEGCAGSGTLTIDVFDPSGAQVTGSAPYASSIAITGNDPSLSASPATITAPGQTSTLSYSGAAFGSAITNSVTVTLTVGSVGTPMPFTVQRSYLYVANSNAPIGSPPTCCGNVSVYQYGASGSAMPVRKLFGTNTGLVTPTKPLVDSAGNLYVLDNGVPVSNSFNPTISVFAPDVTGNVAPLRTINNFSSIAGGYPCSDMVFDPTGAYLVVACGSQINVFPVTASGPASSAYTAELSDDDADEDSALAFDRMGNLYISDESAGPNQILFASAPIPVTGGGYYMIGSSGNTTLLAGTAWPASLSPQFMVVDNAGTLYAPFFYLSPTNGAPDSVAELGIWKTTTLPCNNCAASASLTGAPFTTHAFTGVALDPAGNVYVDNIQNNQINVIPRATVLGATLGSLTGSTITLANTSSGTTQGALGMTVGP